MERRRRSSPWNDRTPIREALFGIDRLEQHAESLAKAQDVTKHPTSVYSLQNRLSNNAKALRETYQTITSDLESGHGIAHAAEWLLDNYHVVEKQIRDIRTALPPRYYDQLPKLADGPFAGYPKVFGLAWAFVAHTDSHFDPQALRQFIRAYQRVQLLTIGELWAVAITLRIVLIENLRRLGDQIDEERAARAEAESLAETLLQTGRSKAALDSDIAAHLSKPLSDTFIVHLSKRLRDQDQRTMPAITWLEEMAKRQGLSLDDLVQRTQQKEGATNLTVRNVITSMRLISDIDWAALFESVSLVDERLNQDHDFYAMDFSTRNVYRSAIEQLARGSEYSEVDIAEAALNLCREAGFANSPSTSARAGEPGYYLIAEGRTALEKAIQFKAPARLRISRFNLGVGIGGYIGTIIFLSFSLLGSFLYWLYKLDTQPLLLWAMAVIGIIPASEAATSLINRFIVWSIAATALPGLELKTGIPPALRTLVAVPILLTDEAELLQHIERLEVHYLSGVGGDLYFALLSDGADAEEEEVLSDLPLLALAKASIAELNQKYAEDDDLVRSTPRFLFLHRKRLFNATEGKWIGWERKRGKLRELNRLLRGAKDTTFVTVDGDSPQVPEGIRYVVTLDADTRLPRDVVGKLIGKMAHPLNHAIFNASQQRVVQGYGILQPRVTPSLPLNYEGSLFQRIFSAPGGIDPYAAASSDVYQDMFGEGSYTGKGIYDIDAFESALGSRVPENTLLSHDLFEGIYACAGLASDIEVVEESPTRYDVSAKRQHRWTRGDWQLLPWIFSLAPDRYLPMVGRWKMIDNLRRSLVAPSYLAILALCWWLPLLVGLKAMSFVLLVFAIPTILPVLFSLLPHRRDFQLRNHSRNVVKDIWQVLSYVFLSIALLVDQSLKMADAIVRTFVRLFFTHKHLLEWTTAAKSKGNPSLTMSGFYQEMAGSLLFAIMISTVTVVFNPASWPMVLPFSLLWLFAPFLAFSASAISASKTKAVDISGVTAESLRLTARRTWRFFERFVTPLDNMLPPDNFQEEPVPVIAHRTSPTNIGLYLLSTVVARDFGWSGTLETIERLEATFTVLQQLPKFRGHLFNWYGTLDLRVLDPAYISSVDSGNLAGHLIALANACDEWAGKLVIGDAKAGMLDHLTLVRHAVLAPTIANSEAGTLLMSRLDEIATLLNDDQLMHSLPALKRLAEKAAVSIRSLMPVIDPDSPPDAVYWIDALVRSVTAHQQDQLQLQQASGAITSRLHAIAESARSMAMAMDFAFLIEPERKLLSIGYSLQDNSLDASCYDLLASEARLASLFTIAKGDVSTKHWFRLGRTATPIGNGSALISWSGSMFEYLMPSLVMRAPVGSLLEQTNKLIVDRQQDYAKSSGVPWGISESAYNARDIEFTYQYSNFGIPGLGLKRGLSENLVIAPYATGLATMVDATRAQANFALLASMGAAGNYGFYEALDFTPSRLREDQSVAIVRNYMAHHQGMTIVAIANCLRDGEMRNRFHREPMIQSCELLLQERMPRDIAIAHPRAEEVNIATDASDSTPYVRKLTDTHSANPITHLLSNGAYSIMITATGAGYSRWHETAISRWSADTTREEDGCYIFIKDVASGDIWTSAGQDIRKSAVTPKAGTNIIFSEAHAEFVRHDNHLLTQMDVVVSGEENAEVRRVSLTNNSRRPYELELTSYLELVLASAASDKAHPAFSKMFVVTEYLAEFGALLATRRLRSANDTQLWAAHFCVVDADTSAPLQYESDRARFIGREKTVKSASVITSGEKLSNTVGTVLDPIFSLRNRVTLAPGKVAKLAYWTVVASSRQALLDIIDKHHDRSAFERAHTLAWTLSQVQMRYLDITSEEAANFQKLAAPALYADHRFRSHTDVITRGAGSQSGLWSQSISGDLPIVLLRIDDLEDMPKVHELLRAHQYWKMKHLFVDLVIINERASSYVQDLQIAIETAVRTSQARRRDGENLSKGIVFTLRADLMSLETRSLLQSVARIAFTARQGLIAQQLARVPESNYMAPVFPGVVDKETTALKPSALEPLALARDLEFFNGFGGFAQDGKEYVTVLTQGKITPAPWINVISNGQFGFQVSAAGSGYTWTDNSRENQITPWSNDAVMDPSGEVFYVRDENNGIVSSPTAQPLRDDGTYVARHGFGYSQFQHESNALELTLLQYVPLEDPVKISRLTIRNLSESPRRISVTAYTEWVLGTSRTASGPFITSEIDGVTGAFLVRNPWSISYANRVTFTDLAGKQTDWTADRTEFIGRYGDLSQPKALLGKQSLSGNVGAGMDPCAALQRNILLAPGESIEVSALLGQCASVEDARAVIQRYRETDLDVVLNEVKQYWQNLLGAIQVKTPDRSMDIMLNGWLLYQTMACRILARSAFYQASGAYGFRDQLQDCMAMSFVAPEISRRHLLRAAGRQFVEGDMQHWWQPQTGQGVRTRISDDCVWLAFCTAHYVECAGDAAVLHEEIPFLEGQLLREGEHDCFFQPMIGDEAASLYEHCVRGLELSIQRTGEHGLPLMGTGDWNDGMNNVGKEGRGESVWLGWLLIRTIMVFAPIAASRHTAIDDARVKRWYAHADAVRQSIEREAWDGEWYRRATFDDGSWLGSQESDECQIDSIAQSWAVISGAADANRVEKAMASLEQYLINQTDALALLFTPPFEHTHHDPGYIKGYPAGLRENGGQYSHAAMWTVLAFAKLGQGGKAADLFAMLNPVNHALDQSAAERYKVEPYVIAADVYSVAPHTGRGGWTWYTGSAGWMYRAGVEGILGIRRVGNDILVKPCIPETWPAFEVEINLQDTKYSIQVENHGSTGSLISSATSNGIALTIKDSTLKLPLDGGVYTLVVRC
jgi:cyclic beta-1,2-glucan synthetase